MAIPMAGPILSSEGRNPASDPQQDCNEINLCREEGGRTGHSAVISDPRCSSVVLLPTPFHWEISVAEESIWLILSSCPCIPSCEWIQYLANGAHSKFECLHFWRSDVFVSCVLFSIFQALQQILEAFMAMNISRIECKKCQAKILSMRRPICVIDSMSDLVEHRMCCSLYMHLITPTVFHLKSCYLGLILRHGLKSSHDMRVGTLSEAWDMEQVRRGSEMHCLHRMCGMPHLSG